MINIKVFFDKLFFYIFKRHIFIEKKENIYDDNESDDNYEEILFLENLKE
jgi:hypothetical protein